MSKKEGPRTGIGKHRLEVLKVILNNPGDNLTQKRIFKRQKETKEKVEKRSDREATT